LNIRQHKTAIPERGETNEVSPTIASFHLGRFSRLQLKEQDPSYLPKLRRQSRESERPKQQEFTGHKTTEKRASREIGSFKDLQGALQAFS
jgi:hypothetical protein